MNCLVEYYYDYLELYELVQQLEKMYRETCDLLTCLEKQSIIMKIRKSIKSVKKIKKEYVSFKKDVKSCIDWEFENFPELPDIEEELLIDDVSYDSTGRENQFKQTSNYRYVRRD